MEGRTAGREEEKGRLIHLSGLVPVLDGVPLVYQFFALGHRDVQLGITAARNKQPGRHHRYPHVTQLSLKLVEFSSLHEQLPNATRLMGDIAGIPISVDVHIEDEQLVSIELAISLYNARFSSSDALDFGTAELYARRVAVRQEVAKSCLFVLDLHGHGFEITANCSRGNLLKSLLVISPQENCDFICIDINDHSQFGLHQTHCTLLADHLLGMGSACSDRRTF